MVSHSRHIEGNTDSAPALHQEAKILGEEMMKPENLELAKKLIDRGSTTEEKLKAAEKLAALHFPKLDICDTDGKVRHLDITTDKGSNGRNIVQVFADDQVALRGVEEQGKFSKQVNAKGREVNFSGDNFQRDHSDSVLLSSGIKDIAAPTEKKEDNGLQIRELKITGPANISLNQNSLFHNTFSAKVDAKFTNDALTGQQVISNLSIPSLNGEGKVELSCVGPDEYGRRDQFIDEAGERYTVELDSSKKSISVTDSKGAVRQFLKSGGEIRRSENTISVIDQDGGQADIPRS